MAEEAAAANPQEVSVRQAPGLHRGRERQHGGAAGGRSVVVSVARGEGALHDLQGVPQPVGRQHRGHLRRVLLHAAREQPDAGPAHQSQPDHGRRLVSG